MLLAHSYITCLFSQILHESVAIATIYLIFQHRVVFSSFVQNQDKFDIYGGDLHVFVSSSRIRIRTLDATCIII